MHAQDAHTPTPHPFCLTLTCPSEPGQVAAVVGFLDRRGGYVDELAVFDDKSKQRFFLRCIFGGAAAGTGCLEARFRRHRGVLRHVLAGVRPDAAAQGDHHGVQAGPLPGGPAVPLAHGRAAHGHRRHRVQPPRPAPLAREHAIAFHHLPVTPQTKPEQEARLLRLVEDSGADLVVLARYMQVLSPDATARLAGRAINIHHSFLPGFKGARLSPGLRTRRQADRGHRALRDRGSGRRPHHRTDGGPRGPQLRPAQLLAAGRDMECVALARAVRLYLERRVFINDNRTVVL